VVVETVVEDTVVTGNVVIDVSVVDTVVISMSVVDAAVVDVAVVDAAVVDVAVVCVCLGGASVAVPTEHVWQRCPQSARNAGPNSLCSQSRLLNSTHSGGSVARAHEGSVTAATVAVSVAVGATVGVVDDVAVVAATNTSVVVVEGAGVETVVSVANT
jgi:hypothetical protein